MCACGRMERRWNSPVTAALVWLGPAAIGLEASGGYEREALAALCAVELTAHRPNALRTVHGVLKRMAARRIASLKADILLIDQAMAEAVAADERMAPATACFARSRASGQSLPIPCWRSCASSAN